MEDDNNCATELQMRKNIKKLLKKLRLNERFVRSRNQTLAEKNKEIVLLSGDIVLECLMNIKNYSRQIY